MSRLFFFEDNLLRYERDIKLAGIIYLHRITDNPMPATGRPHCDLNMFGELCGDQAVKKVMLVTTMWDKVQQDIGARRERDLVEKYWRTMIDYGASTARFLNSAGSAWEIVDLILKQHETEYENRVELEVSSWRLQEENVEDNPQLALQLGAELKNIHNDFDKTFNEMRRLKVPFWKWLMLLIFGKKSQGVRFP